VPGTEVEARNSADRATISETAASQFFFDDIAGAPLKMNLYIIIPHGIVLSAGDLPQFMGVA
jgi:hypothetical protein